MATFIRTMYYNPSIRTGTRYYRNISIAFGLIGGTCRARDASHYSRDYFNRSEVRVMYGIHDFCAGFIEHSVWWLPLLYNGVRQRCR